MDKAKLEGILSSLPDIKVAVFGDFFLDRYFEIDARLAEVSIETGLTAHQIVGKRLSPGAAGTVVSNLKALGVGEVICVGVIGIDGEGFELKRGLSRIGANIKYLIEREDRFTPCYTKPMLNENGKERELERLDIKNRERLYPEIEDQLISMLQEIAPGIDGMIVADQVQERNVGVVTDRIRDFLSELAKHNPRISILADSRVRIGEYSNIMTKPNKFEVVDAILGNARADKSKNLNIETSVAIDCAKELYKRTQKPVFLTAQEEGIFIIDSNSVTNVPAIPISGEIDPVGAGDSCAAGIVSALCSRASNEDAALFGNLVASITIQKLGQPGQHRPKNY